MKKILNKLSQVIQKDESEQEDRKKIDELAKYKQNWEPRWYLAQAFYEGVHFTYPKKDKEGQWQRKNETGKYKVIREIPKAKKQLKSIRNLILRLRQRPVVYPDVNVILADSERTSQNQMKIEAEKKAAELQSRYVDYYLNEVMKLSRHKNKLIKYAELYHCSFIQILNDNNKKELAVYSPFEISIFPTISNINDYPIVCKHISRRFDELKGNDLYDQDVIADMEKKAKTGKYSKSIYQDTYLTERFGHAPDDNVVVDEIYEIIRVTKNAEGELVEDIEKYEAEYQKEQETLPEEERTEMELKDEFACRIRAYIDDAKVRDEITKLTKIPMSIFCWGDEAYATSIMEDLMPMNKAYDIFISKLEHKAKKMDTGRYLIQKGEDVKVLTTNDGEFIRYKRVKPDTMKEASVPNAFQETVQLLENDMKEQGVALTSAASLPPGVEAWRAIESLKDIDYEGIGEQRDNLNECLTDLTEKLTEMLAYDMVDIEFVTIKDETGNPMQIKVIGKRGAEILQENGELPPDVLVIDPCRLTKVEIESDSTWTKEGQRYMVLDMVKAGLLPKESAMETLKLGNTKDIVAKLIQEETFGKSMIDTPDFQVLPNELKEQILTILANGAPNGNSTIPPIGGNPQSAQQ
jgi:hypothetical protein